MKRTVLVMISAICMLTAVQADDLDRYIQRIKARPAGRIESFPEFKIPKAHVYSSGHLRDPFIKTSRKNERYQPDLKRSKEPLEGYALDSLRMVGSYTKQDPKTHQLLHWALIATSNNTIYPVTLGGHIGRHLGRVIEITPGEVKIIEEIKTHIGWEKRPTSLIISDE